MNNIKEDFRRVLARVDALPPISSVFFKIISLTESKESSREELIRCISLDQSIAAKVLQTINSAYFGLKQKVSSLEVAVGLLGDQEVHDIAILCSASSVLRTTLGGYGVLAEQFWLHSVSTAIASRLIADHCRPEKREVAFVAGLLHDIGKMALKHLVAESNLNFSQDPDRDDILPKFHSKETDAFGFDHCAIGYFLARNWNFSEELTATIGLHHYPEIENEYRDLICIVCFADTLAHLISMGINDYDFVVVLHDEGRIPFELSAQEVEDIFLKLTTEIEDSKAFLGM